MQIKGDTTSRRATSTSQGSTAKASRARTLPPCDLVLKGGITSGVVYPRAISRLAKSRQIKGVGGTSAGAIAAAFAAAAEYRRRRTDGFEGFERLDRIVADLATRVKGKTRLEGLFQPQKETRLPFALLKFLLTASKLKKLGLFTFLPLGLLWFSVWLGTLLFSGAFQASPSVSQTMEFAAWYVVALILVGLGVKRFVSNLVAVFCRQNYGLCRGYDPRNCCPESPQLTQWIHDELQKTAGLTQSEPLTFAHLEGEAEFLSSIESPVKGLELSPQDRVKLRLVTTSLTHSRPYTLPFQDDRFYFDPIEFRELFPPSVVDWMLENSRAKPITISSEVGEPLELYALPEHGHLPVVVAVRLSLSMPIILSAINLYCRDLAHPDNLPEKVIFTDGGIVSNFPIHFFDEFVPSYPTFGLNLIFAKRELSQVHHLLLGLHNRVFGQIAGERNTIVADMARCLLEHWDRRPGLGGFLEGIYDTARGWKDTTQLRLPGYRDRVQDIYLDPRKEGGIHLSMPPEQIEALAQKGEEAVDHLLAKFSSRDGVASASWKNHVWTRYRITMLLLSQKLQSLRKVLADQEFQELLRSAAHETVGFQFGPENSDNTDWRGDWNATDQPPTHESHLQGIDMAHRATTDLVDFLEKWDCSVFSRSNLPMPLPTIRMVKEV